MSKPDPPSPTALEIAIKEMEKFRNKRPPGLVWEEMGKLIQIAKDHLDLDPVLELDSYAQGFKEGNRIKNP
jgi:hypothetical protein